jgi:hypothetical protein
MSVMAMVDVDRVVEGMALARRVLLHSPSRMMILHLKAMLGEKFIGEISMSPRCFLCVCGSGQYLWRGGGGCFSACVFFVSSHAYESHVVVYFLHDIISPPPPATQHSFTTIINTALI